MMPWTALSISTTLFGRTFNRGWTMGNRLRWFPSPMHCLLIITPTLCIQTIMGMRPWLGYGMMPSYRLPLRAGSRCQYLWPPIQHAQNCQIGYQTTRLPMAQAWGGICRTLSYVKRGNVSLLSKKPTRKSTDLIECLASSPATTLRASVLPITALTSPTQ